MHNNNISKLKKALCSKIKYACSFKELIRYSVLTDIKPVYSKNLLCVFVPRHLWFDFCNSLFRRNSRSEAKKAGREQQQRVVLSAATFLPDKWNLIKTF